MEVRVQTVPARQVACWRHDGPYGGLAQVVRAATDWLRARREPGGALETVFLDAASLEAAGGEADAAAPADTAHHAHGHDEGPGVRVEVHVAVSPGFSVDAEGAPDDAEVRVHDAAEARMAVVRYEGDPRTLPKLASALRAFLSEQGHMPAAETHIVHEMPDWERLAAWRAEVRVPLAVQTS